MCKFEFKFDTVSNWLVLVLIGLIYALLHRFVRALLYMPHDTEQRLRLLLVLDALTDAQNAPFEAISYSLA